MSGLFEPYVQLVDVTAEAALIAWGGFRLVERGDVPGGWVAGHTGETFGSRSAPYGRAVVEVVDGEGSVVGRTVTDGANHAWVEGLRPATTYGYRVLVDGVDWTARHCYDWTPTGLGPAWRRLAPQLRTHAAADQPDPVTFLALGDFGVGIADHAAGERQLGVARTMQRLADAYDVRFLVGLGDSIYHGPGGSLDQTGADDEDWWLTFFQPYRYLLDHLPFYPTAGNHDAADTENSDDREQLEDNLYLRARFEPRVHAGRASMNPGLFYRLQVGALLELVCVDTTWGVDEGRHWFDDPGQREWLHAAFAHDDVVWQVPFSHHPPYGAGPHHEPMAAQHPWLVPLYHASGVRLTLHGHEHNFQHGVVDGLHHVISGAGGKLEQRPPTRLAASGTVSWAAEPHCLLVQMTEEQIVVVPYGATAPGGSPVPITRLLPDGTPTTEPIVVPRDPG